MTTGAESEMTVHRLHPLRVLVSGRDRRFVRVTSFLLSQRGYDVEQTSPKSVLVVFGGDEDESWQGLSTVKKWTPIDTLVEQIEAAALDRPAPLTERERAYR